MGNNKLAVISVSSRLRTILPFLSWEKPTSHSLRADLFAGLTVALCLIPQSMAYAELANLPPWIGLYASFLPVIIAALLGSSNHLQSGPVAMVSLLTATALAPLAIGTVGEYVAAASMLAVVVGICWILFGALRLTFIVNFISRPVIEGFVNAGALIIAASQIGKLVGVTTESGSFFTRAYETVIALPEANLPSAVVGCLSLAMMILIRRFFPKLPNALIVVVAMIGITYHSDYAVTEVGREGITVLGSIPQGLPNLAMPEWSFDTILKFSGGAITLVLVGFLEMSSISRAIASQSRQTLDLNKEVIGQGVASVVAGFSGSYPTGGSFSRTALNFSAGAKSPMAAVFTGIFALLAIQFATGALYFLPKAALAAIIIAAVIRLFNPKVFAEFWSINRGDGIVLTVTFLATLLCAPHLEWGIMLGIAMSIGHYVYVVTRKYAKLINELRTSDVSSIATDDVMPVVHFGGDLSFTNVSDLDDTLMDIAARCKTAPQICIDCTGISGVDVSIIALFEKKVVNIRKAGSELVFAGFRPEVMALISKSRLEEIAGDKSFFPSVWDARNALAPESIPSANFYVI